MEELTKEYLTLFNGITDTVQKLETMTFELKLLQVRAEEEYLNRMNEPASDAATEKAAVDA